MENKIEYGKIAAKLTLVSAISATVFALITGLAIGSANMQISKAAMILIVSLIAISGMYLILGWYFRKNYNKWNIALIKDTGSARTFSGVAFAALMFGFYWRTILIGFVTGAIGAMLKNMYGMSLTNVTELGVDLFVNVLNFYIAFYWLIRAQYGSFRIVELESDVFKNAVIEHGATTIEDAKTSIKDSVISVLGTVAVLSFYGLGFVQIFATYDFFRHYWEWNWFISVIGAMFIGYMPVVGSIAGVVAATKVWGWELWAAVLLFFYPIVLWIVIMILGGTVTLFQSITKK